MKKSLNSKNLNQKIFRKHKVIDALQNIKGISALLVFVGAGMCCFPFVCILGFVLFNLSILTFGVSSIVVHRESKICNRMEEFRERQTNITHQTFNYLGKTEIVKNEKISLFQDYDINVDNEKNQ